MRGFLGSLGSMRFPRQICWRRSLTRPTRSGQAGKSHGSSSSVQALEALGSERQQHAQKMAVHPPGVKQESSRLWMRCSLR